MDSSNRKTGFHDDLLKDFSDIQKEFIINEVYPSLKQALLNFIQKSIESNLFDKKMKKLVQVQMASDFNQTELDQLE
jgi:hypothetical protein